MPGMSDETEALRAYLTRVPLFEGAPERAVTLAATAMRRRVFETGTTIFREGDAGEALYILGEGLVKLSKVDLAGHEKTLVILQPPEFFGEMAVLGRATRSATALTLNAVTVYVLFSDDFSRLITDYPVISLNLIATLAARLRGMDDEAQILSYKDAQGRVAYVLLRLYREGVVNVEEDRTLLRLTHQELASLAGTSRETVTRALKALEGEGVIETRPREVFITDLEGLVEILHGIR